MPRKEFEAFTRLDASDVNSFLMDQTVMSFAGTAARGSAIPSPVEGMYTHLEDAPARTEFWTGSAWQTPSGLTLLRQEPIGTTVGSVVFNNIFSSTYDAYRVVIVGSTSSAASFLRLSFPSVDIRWASWRAGVFDSARGGSLGESSMPVGRGHGSGAPAVLTAFEIINPFSTTWTHISVDNFQETGNVDTYMISGMQQNLTSFTSFTITPASGTLTGGIISVYGYRKD
jgi:hypothetical protein